MWDIKQEGFFIVVLHLLTSDNLSPVVRLSLRNFCFCLVNVGHISAPKAFIDEMSLLHMCVCIQVYRKRETHTHIHTYIKTKTYRHIHSKYNMVAILVSLLHVRE